MNNYESARDQMTQRILDDTLHIAAVMGQRQAPPTAATHPVNYTYRVTQFQWLLRHNFAAQGFAGASDNGQIRSTIYVDAQKEILDNLAVVYRNQLADAPSSPSGATASQPKSDEILNRYDNCVQAYQDFTSDHSAAIKTERMSAFGSAGLAALKLSKREMSVLMTDLARTTPPPPITEPPQPHAFLKPYLWSTFLSGGRP